MQHLKLFIRQSYTEAGLNEMSVIQGMLELLKNLNGHPNRLELTTGAKAYNKDNFKQAYEEETGNAFTPVNFRRTRLELLHSCDAMIIIRTGMSESTAFELCHNLCSSQPVPVFFAILKGREIRTTLLQDLDDFADVEYHSFEQPEDIRLALVHFLDRIAWAKADKLKNLAKERLAAQEVD